MKIRIVLLAFLAGSGAFAQSVINGNRQILGTLDLSSGLGMVLPHLASDPSGACTALVTSRIHLVVSDATGYLFTCRGGTWQVAGATGGGGGGLADPGSNGMFKRTSLNTTAPAVSGTDFEAPGAAAAAIASSAQRASNLSDLANVGTARTNLGLGTAATQATSAFEAAGLATLKSANLSDLANAGTARTNLGLGTAATSASSAFEVAGAAATAQSAAIAASVQRASNLSDLASAATARTNLGLGTAATQATGAFDAAGAATTAQSAAIAASAQRASNLSDLASVATARTNLGLGAAALLAVDTAGGVPALNGSGYLVAARLNAFQGDVSKTAGDVNANVLVLKLGNNSWTIDQTSGDVAAVSGGSHTGNFGTFGTVTAKSFALSDPTSSAALDFFDQATGTFKNTLQFSGDAATNVVTTIPYTGANITLACLTCTQTMTGKTFTTPIIDAINDANGNSALQIDTTASQVNGFRITPGATGTGVTISPDSSGDANSPLNVTGKGSGNVVVISTLLALKHVGCYGGTPTRTLIGTLGTGGSPDVTVTGSDCAGEVTIITGSAGPTTLSAELFRITFANAYTAAPYCTWTPTNGASNNAAVAVRLQYIRGASSTAFISIYGGSTTLAASTTYTYNYNCQQG